MEGRKERPSSAFHARFHDVHGELLGAGLGLAAREKRLDHCLALLQKLLRCDRKVALLHQVLGGILGTRADNRPPQLGSELVAKGGQNGG